MANNVQAQSSVSDGESALVYSLPKTVFNIEIQTEKVTQKPGIFYRYSERYLATNKVVTEEKTTYKLKRIIVKQTAIQDPNRTYSFEPNNNSKNCSLTLNSEGILCGVNVNGPKVLSTSADGDTLVTDNVGSDDLLPLGEEYMMAGSEAKLAEGVAKQIYHIRESRISLLTADVDKLPADGESFKTMLNGLNKLESKLTELFVGKKIIEIQTQTIAITPSAPMTNEILFRLSELKGIVSSSDLSGVPYYINIIPSVSLASSNNSKLKNSDTSLYYVLPVSTQISINDGINTMYNNTFFVPQFGKIVSIPESIFKQPNLKIHIDPQTGRLLSVE